VKVVYHNVPSTLLDIPGLEFEAIQFETPRTELDLVLHVYESRQALHGVFEYRSGLFEAATISRFAALFALLLDRLLLEPGATLGASVDFLTLNDRKLHAAAREDELRGHRDKLRSADRRSVRIGA
jgi:non-ribosomal peptide synthetase component F